jgi:hypothetical protein
MKNTLLLAVILLCTTILPTLAADAQQSMTDVNSPTFNSTPSMNMAGSMVNMQNNYDNVSKVGDVQCGNTSWGAGGYNGEIHSGNSIYGTRSHNYGGMANISGSYGDADTTCRKALKASYDLISYQAQMMKFNTLDKNVAVCITLILQNVIISDQLKEMKPELAMCDHMRILKKEQPKLYAKAQVAVKPVAEVQYIQDKKKVLDHHRQYRIWFGNHSSCSYCGDSYKEVVKSLVGLHRGSKTITKGDVFVIPYESNGIMKFSVNIKKGLYTWKEAYKLQNELGDQGVYGTIRGVRGTEVYR